MHGTKAIVVPAVGGVGLFLWRTVLFCGKLYSLGQSRGVVFLAGNLRRSLAYFSATFSGTSSSFVNGCASFPCCSPLLLLPAKVPSSAPSPKRDRRRTKKGMQVKQLLVCSSALHLRPCGNGFNQEPSRRSYFVEPFQSYSLSRSLGEKWFMTGHLIRSLPFVKINKHGETHQRSLRMFDEAPKIVEVHSFEFEIVQPLKPTKGIFFGFSLSFQNQIISSSGSKHTSTSPSQPGRLL